jgi:hypothetical protein
LWWFCEILWTNSAMTEIITVSLTSFATSMVWDPWASWYSSKMFLLLCSPEMYHASVKKKSCLTHWWPWLFFSHPSDFFIHNYSTIQLCIPCSIKKKRNK